MNEFFWILFIYIFGLTAMIVELFIPGAIIGITGFLAVCGSIIFAFVTEHSALATVLIGFTILYIPFFFLLCRKVLGSIFALKDSEKTFRASINNYDELQGHTGHATSSLRPSGTAEIDGRRYAVVTRGGMIDKGQKVEVIDVAGSRLTVKVVDQKENN